MSETINNSASTIYTINGSTNTANSNVLPVDLNSSSGLVLTKTSNVSTFSVGEIITYTITITNSSPYYLNGVRIIDNLGGGNLAYVISSGSLTTSSQTYPVSPIATSPLTFTLQQLGVGETMTLTYKAQVVFNLPQTVSLITNSVQGIGYPHTGTITGYASHTIQKKTDVNFSITKSSNITEIEPNQSFNYYITLTNNTSSLATISSITDDLPTNYTLTSVKLKVGSGTEITLNGTDYTLSSSNLLTIPSMSGPAIIVPANGSTVVTLTGYFN